LHATSFVVGHFHFTMGLAAIFASTTAAPSSDLSQK